MTSEDAGLASSREDYLKSFRELLRREGLKSTRQRDLIIDEFSRVEGHVGVEDLLARVRLRDASVGYATVYRTLKILSENGLAASRNFGEGYARFEPLMGEHHDHLVCESCGRIEEFHDEVLEKRQEVVAAEMGFELTHHRHELFGYCPDCREKLTPESTQEKQSEASLPDAFEAYLNREGLKRTRQRELISGLFAEADDHLSVDDLLERVQQSDKSIGYATVYRTLKLLVDAGLAVCRHFGDGFTRFEARAEAHHDHLIDESNGDVREFHDHLIESRQEAVASAHGFALTRHRHDLFGRPRAQG